MKFILLCIVLFSTPVLFAKVEGDFLSPVERSEVIRSIDDVCGDTWCEGDYNFKFNNFSCNFREKNCDLTFYFIKSDDQDVEIYSPLQVCHRVDYLFTELIKRWPLTEPCLRISRTRLFKT